MELQAQEKSKLMAITDVVNKWKDKKNGKPFFMNDAKSELKKRGVLQVDEIMAILERRAIIQKTGNDEYYRFTTMNRLHYTLFRSIINKDECANAESCVDIEAPTEETRNSVKEKAEGLAFKNLLLDVQFYQRKKQNYMLSKLRREYNVRDFPKNKIPDLVGMSITDESADKMYKDIVVKHYDEQKEKALEKKKQLLLTDIAANAIESLKEIKVQLAEMNIKCEEIFKRFDI